MPFVPRLSTTSPTPMANNPWWYSNGNIFYASGFGLENGGNCTCYAYGRYAEIQNQFVFALGGTHGDAKYWWDTTTGLTKGKVPQLGAVMCWGSRSGQHGGHVAVVEQIMPNGDVVASESGWQSFYFRTTTYTASSEYYCGFWGGDYYFQGFIYNIPQVMTSPYVVAAMCGNWRVESSMNPGIWESLIPCAWDFQYDYTHKGGFGLGQWTNVGTPYGRTWNLHQYVTSNGYQDGDGNGQLAFLIAEDFWVNAVDKRGSYTNLSEFLSSTSQNLQDLTYDFLHCWEAGGAQGDFGFATRYDGAQRALDYIQQHASDPPSNYSWVTGNFFITPYSQDFFNNVMCVYFWFTSYAPIPGPNILSRKNKMPIWMMLKYW